MKRRPPLSAMLPLALLASGLTACMTVNQRSERAAPAPAINSLPGEAWTVIEGTDTELGFVVRFEEISPTQEVPRAFYSVRNPHGQELGLVDELGRAWRYRPHVHDPDWISTGSVSEGVAAILDGGPGVRLYPADLASIKNRLCLNSAEQPTRQGS